VDSYLTRKFRGVLEYCRDSPDEIRMIVYGFMVRSYFRILAFNAAVKLIVHTRAQTILTSILRKINQIQIRPKRDAKAIRITGHSSGTKS